MNFPTVSERQTILANYERVTSPWMSLLALLYLLSYTAQSIFYYPTEAWFQAANTFGNILWLLFAMDLTFRFVMTTPKKGFFRKNWLETITVVLPQFRALRVLRTFSKNGILAKSGKSPLTSGGLATAALGTVIVVWVGSLMVLNAERGAKGATINNFGDALWWAMETITTVGYGDVVPVTSSGRIMATFVMMLGISVLGAVTAGLSASLARQSGHHTPPSQLVLDELAELKSMVAALQAHAGIPAASDTPGAPGVDSASSIPDGESEGALPKSPG
jgi:voltage-gated potassium channel